MLETMSFPICFTFNFYPDLTPLLIAFEAYCSRCRPCSLLPTKGDGLLLSSFQVDAVSTYGGNVIFSDVTIAAREDTCAKVQQETGAVFIHPYNYKYGEAITVSWLYSCAHDARDPQACYHYPCAWVYYTTDLAPINQQQGGMRQSKHHLSTMCIMLGHSLVCSNGRPGHHCTRVLGAGRAPIFRKWKGAS